MAQTVKIVFVEHNGREHAVDARVGHTVMQAAVAANVPGIEAECGGLCTCGTCQGMPDALWLDKLDAQADCEKDLLAMVADGAQGVRLTCQIQVRPELDGMVVRLPPTQY